MSTTTQILFNSPALHSLKREQLVKLCKIHSIKASGKNVELIQKLRLHAQTLPKDSPLSIAARSEEHGPIAAQAQAQAEDQEREIEDDASSYQSSRPPRPSEQWEMVMDSIEEVEEDSSQGTLSSQRTVNHNGHAGEFGTGSSKSSTVGSSIKALATSLGLKRTHTNSKSTLSSTTSSKSSSAFPPPSIQESTTDELAQMSTPYSSLPESTYLPQTDHFTLHEAGNRASIGSTTVDMDTEVLPGHALRPGVPAPPNARLSLGLGLGATPATPSRKAQPTTTIRLVGNPLSANNIPGGTTFDTSYSSGDFGTPQLKPFKTTFEITFGSPAPSNAGFGSSNLNVWPPRGADEDVHMRGIYPTLTFDDLPPTVEVKTMDTATRQATSAPADEDVAMPGSLMPNPTSTLATPSKSKSTSNPPSPFIFGTPQHKVTDDQFRTAAAAVLEEMNAKLREDGVDEITTDIISKLHPDAAKNRAMLSPRQIKPLPGSKIADKFDKMHEEEFRKMEGIDEVVRRRAERASPVKKPAEEERAVVGRKRKSSVLERDGGPKRPSVLAGRASNTRVISAGRRAKAKVLPGGFDLDDEDDDLDSSPEQSAEAEAEVRGGKRAKMDPDFVPPTAEEQAAEAEKEEKKRVQLQEEKEAIKKKLEANRARRRSSALQGHGYGVLAPRKSGAGRVSIGRPRHSVLTKPKPKPSKFGFLSSAKSLVQSVWNRGKTAAPAAFAPASNIPKAVASSSSKLDPTKEKERTTSSSKMVPPSLLPAKKSSVAPAKSTAATAAASGGKVVSGSKTSGLGASSSSTMSSSRSRSPLPSFNNNGTLQSNSSAGTKASSRMSSVAGTGRSRMSSTTNAQSGVSSIGTRMSRMSGLTSSSNASGVGSMGMKGGESRTSTTGTRSSSRLSATSSRLLAPTASSLAKMAARAGGDNHTVNTTATTAKQALGPITNSPALHSNNATRINSPAPSATFSPKQIFSKPLTLGHPSPSGIPVAMALKRRGHIRGSSQSSTNSNGNAGEGAKAKESTTPAAVIATATNTGSIRTRSLNGRKPRISRSKVIARLASQREHGPGSSNRVASGSSLASNTSTASGATSTLAPKAGRASAGKTRSSLGAKVARPHARASYAGSDKRLAVRTSSGGVHDNVLMSAKKRLRRSEYARRKSQRVSVQRAGVGKLNFGDVEGGENRMEVE